MMSGQMADSRKDITRAVPATPKITGKSIIETSSQFEKSLPIVNYTMRMTGAETIDEFPKSFFPHFFLPIFPVQSRSIIDFHSLKSSLFKFVCNIWFTLIITCMNMTGEILKAPSLFLFLIYNPVFDAQKQIITARE